MTAKPKEFEAARLIKEAIAKMRRANQLLDQISTRLDKRLGRRKAA